MRNFKATVTLLILCMLAVLVFLPAQAQTFTVLHNFIGGQDGQNPIGGLAIDQAGSLYGTALYGGSADNCSLDQGCGAVFKLARKGSGWIFTPLYSFAGGDDGASPHAAVIFGPDGTLYGTTFHGGGTGCAGQGCGTVFNLRPAPSVCKTALCPWVETVLYRFTGGPDGGQPLGDLTFDQAGNLYGTTQLGGILHCGGNGCGVVFELSPAGGTWTETIVYQFGGGADGAFPNGGVAFDQMGNLYGTTLAGGMSNFGTVFQLTPSGSGWTENIIYNFQNLLDGFEPDTGVIFDAFGNLYGTTLLGGTGSGGTVFQLVPSGGEWVYSLLYSLTGIAGPIGTLSMDGAGSLYGTTYQDGAYLYGSAFKLVPADGGWSFTSLHDFTGGVDGAYQYGKAILDNSGSLYGASFAGGFYGYGVVWRITP